MFDRFDSDNIHNDQQGNLCQYKDIEPILKAAVAVLKASHCWGNRDFTAFLKADEASELRTTLEALADCFCEYGD